MEDKKDLAMQHHRLIQELEHLSSILNSRQDPTYAATLERLRLRICQLQRDAVLELEWRSPFE